MLTKAKKISRGTIDNTFYLYDMGWGGAYTTDLHSELKTVRMLDLSMLPTKYFHSTLLSMFKVHIPRVHNSCEQYKGNVAKYLALSSKKTYCTS